MRALAPAAWLAAALHAAPVLALLTKQGVHLHAGPTQQQQLLTNMAPLDLRSLHSAMSETAPSWASWTDTWYAAPQPRQTFESGCCHPGRTHCARLDCAHAEHTCENLQILQLRAGVQSEQNHREHSSHWRISTSAHSRQTPCHSSHTSHQARAHLSASVQPDCPHLQSVLCPAAWEGTSACTSASTWGRRNGRPLTRCRHDGQLEECFSHRLIQPSQKMCPQEHATQRSSVPMQMVHSASSWGNFLLRLVHAESSSIAATSVDRWTCQAMRGLAIALALTAHVLAVGVAQFPVPVVNSTSIDQELLLGAKQIAF